MESIYPYKANSEIWQNVVNKYNRTIQSLDEDVAVLKEWLKTQPHLPDLLDTNSLRNFLLLNKFSIEIAKQKIDNFYTLRKKFEAIYGKINPREEYNEEFCKDSYLVYYPKLTPEMYTIFYFKSKNKILPDSYDPVHFMKRLLSTQEMRLKEDVIVGDIMIVDFTGCPINFLSKMTPQLTYRIVTLYEKIYSFPLKGIYVINLPDFGTMLLSLAKRFLKPKLFNRIHVVKDVESIKEAFSSDLIPEDFAGKGFSLSVLEEALNVSYQKHEGFFDSLDKFEIDESLRPNKLENDDVFGFYGNFKKLDFD